MMPWPTILTRCISLILLSRNVSSRSLGFRRSLVRIFVLAGDDNVEGYAYIPQLTTLSKQNSTRERYQHLLMSGDGGWRTRNDVFVVYDHDRGKKLLHGPWTVQGFGARPTAFGPEVEFGHVMGDIYDDPVIILKAGWSHRSLDKDFRAPEYDQSGAFQWYRLLQNLKYTMQNLEEILGPEYKHARPMLSGLVWWHGYSDFEVKGAVDRYRAHLESWLQAIRSELSLFLPIVVAELGGQGTQNVSYDELSFRQMQLSIVENPQFSRSTKFVATANYVRRAQDEDPLAQEIDTYQHYFGRADTMIDIGRELALALAEMTSDGSSKPKNDSSKNKKGIGQHRTVILSMIILVLGFFGILSARRRSNTLSDDWETEIPILFDPFRDGQHENDANHSSIELR